MQYPGRLLALLFLAAMATHPAQAQSTEDSVKAAVNLLFTGMRTSDASMIRRSFADSAILQTIATDRNGKTFVRSESVEDFATVVSKMEKGDADERIHFDVVRADGSLAIVWTPYSFYYKGKFSHCGVDSYQLLRQGGVWKIQYIIDTRRKDACPAGTPDAP